MRRNQSSWTALGIAINRAYESSKPPGERLCYDPYARGFINPLMYRLIALFIASGYAERRGPGVQTFLAVRERYIDDCLLKRLDESIGQLVILGAGFDSRAYRFDLFQRGIKVFEVDHPATQQVKIGKLKNILPAIPGNVTFVPIDFDKETLDERLPASGYDPRQKTLFIWQGVIHYLTLEGIDRTLGFVANCSGEGSSIVFDYMYRSALKARRKRGEVASMQRYRGMTGEGLSFGVEEGKIEEFLQARGLDHVENVTAEDLSRLYLTGRNAGRRIAPVYAIASASVVVKRER